MSPSSEILTGRIFLLHAFDIGDWIELSKALSLLDEASTLQAAPSRRAPGDFGLVPQPLTWTGQTLQLPILGLNYQAGSRAIVYDFGVISVSIKLDISGTLEQWQQIALALHDKQDLVHTAQLPLEKLLEKIKPAIESPRIGKLNEGYLFFQINPNPGFRPLEWMRENSLVLAQTLRGEPDILSNDEIEESLRMRITYAPQDLLLIDWASAIAVDRNYEDSLAVMDFANAELLEMRLLDHRLDDMLEGAHRMIRKKGAHWRNVLLPHAGEVRRIAELMADAAAEFEAVNNAIKLTNDQFLARVYRLATERFHLKAFDEDIARKLDTLSEIHGIYTERAESRRMELLEWIVIILIAIEVVPLFFR